MIRIVGSGPAASAVESALADVGKTEFGETLEGAPLGVVVGRAGDRRFERADEIATSAEIPWFAVELGGIGGFGVVDGAVTAFGPGGATYRCLQTRVQANHGDDATEPRDVESATARLAGAVAGHELSRLLAGAGVLNRVIVLPYEERPLLAIPEGERDRSLRRDYTERTVEEALARAERALDGLVGIVQEVGEAESFPVPYYLAQTCDTTGFSDVSAARNAAGVDPGWNPAFMKALGEALERYCAGVYRKHEFETGTPEDIEGSVPPEQFVCESDPTDTSIPWVEGENLHSGERVKLPAEFVQYPPPERRYRPAVTTGLGLGNSGVGAILSGLYEVIERDATMLSWYSTFEPMGIDSDDETVETLRSRARSEGLDVALSLVTMDIDVPVVAAAVHRDEWPRFALGTGASLDIDTATRSALSEALQNWMELRGMGPEQASEASGAIGEYAELPDRVADFIDPDVTVAAGTVAEPPPEGEAELSAVVDRLESGGLSAYAARTTTRDVEQLGFEAVRVLIPTAQPLCFGEMVFGERAEQVPQELGFEPRLDRAHHPFP